MEKYTNNGYATAKPQAGQEVNLKAWKMTMINGDRLLLHAMAGKLRITVVTDGGDPVCYEKPMSPTAMRVLSINLQQAALEQEQNLTFVKKS